MIIQNKDNNKILTTYDKRWDMWLFPYKKGTSSGEGTKSDNDELQVTVKYLSETFHIDEIRVHCNLSLTQCTRKHSESDKLFKVYYHRFFKVSVEGLPTDKDEFEIDGIRYRWWSMQDLEIDPKTRLNNSEIVATVKNEVL